MQKFRMGEWVKYLGNKYIVIGYQTSQGKEDMYLLKSIGWVDVSKLSFTTAKEDEEDG